MIYSGVEIIDDNNWNLNDAIPETDWETENANIKISPDFGCGIKTMYENNSYTFKHSPRRKPIVTLEIKTWRGMSSDAIHYYGSLYISLPNMERDNMPGYTVGIYGRDGIPMFSNDKIELTNVLEQWEIDKYPDSYKYYKVGQRYNGFYSAAGVERRAKEVFEKIFCDGWELKIVKLF